MAKAKLLIKRPPITVGGFGYTIQTQPKIDESVFDEQQRVLEEDLKVVIEEMSKLDCASNGFGHYPSQTIMDLIDKGERFISISMMGLSTVFCSKCGCLVGIPTDKLKSQNMKWINKPAEEIPF